MKHFFIIVLSCMLLLYAAVATAVYGDDEVENVITIADGAIEVEADELEYDNITGDIIARGSVEINYSGYQLRAEKVIYNKLKQVFIAEGKLYLKDSHGGKSYSAYDAEIKQDFSVGTIHDLTAFLEPRGMFWAKVGTIHGREVFRVRDAKYTLCKICETNLVANKPLWSVRANEMTKNDNVQRINFKHAFIDIYGVPIFYTPYFSIPTPKAKRKSGFLHPIMRFNNLFGLNARLPFYIDLNSNMDLQVTPWIMQRFGRQISTTFRHLTPQGEYYLTGSIAQNDRINTEGDWVGGKDVRSHIEGKGAFKVRTDKIDGDLGFDFIRLNDDLKTYLKLYHIDNRDILNSKLFFHKFGKQGYYTIDTLYFQGLRTIDNANITPQAYPQVDGYYRFIFDPNTSLVVKGDFLNLYRRQGVNMQRAVFQSNFEHYRIIHGQKLELFGKVRTDLYNVYVANPNGASLQEYLNIRNLNLDVKNSSYGRKHVQIGSRWSYSLIHRSKRYSTIIEPGIAIIFSPRQQQSNNNVNEDSQSPELSIDTLFLKQIFKGYDLWQDGNRIAYSIKSLTHFEKSYISFEVGQAYRYNTNQQFSLESGMCDKLSDVVSRFNFNINNIVHLESKTRLEKGTFNVQDNEIASTVKYGDIQYTVQYYELGANLARHKDLNHRRELKSKVRYNFNKEWQIAYKRHEKLGKNNGDGQKLIVQGAQILYSGECLSVDFSIVRDYTELSDLKARVNYQFRVNVPIP